MYTTDLHPFPNTNYNLSLSYNKEINNLRCTNNEDINKDPTFLTIPIALVFRKPIIELKFIFIYDFLSDKR